MTLLFCPFHFSTLRWCHHSNIPPRPNPTQSCMPLCRPRPAVWYRSPCSTLRETSEAGNKPRDSLSAFVHPTTNTHLNVPFKRTSGEERKERCNYPPSLSQSSPSLYFSPSPSSYPQPQPPRLRFRCPFPKTSTQLPRIRNVRRPSTGTASSTRVPADGTTGMGDGYGPGEDTTVGSSGGMSCIWSDANGCEQ